ncbi:hypothetical protein B0H15DRAFT_919302 [Mycena belliarum]|uniref:Uncharacterized protein n=1 Tax=Mycena belliarum TaxID=1033014 RepID=A0AAD6Y1W8_9AGAR|nr:hypothetical protein B0H15DRAFT_919302 [Mycena belliae]
MFAATNLPQVRRIVTSHDESGLGTIQTDSTLRFEVCMGGARAASVWVTLKSSEDGGNRVVEGIVQPNGTNLRCTDLAPGARTPMPVRITLIWSYLVEGELVLIMDDGSETHLKNPGDTVIQRGTMHAWRNPSTRWARWMCAVVAAEPAIVGGKVLEAETK